MEIDFKRKSPAENLQLEISYEGTFLQKDMYVRRIGKLHAMKGGRETEP